MTHGRPGPNDVPYHILHETVAAVTDDETNTVVITEENGIQRPHPNCPEGLNVDWYEDDTGYSVKHALRLDSGYWNVESRDFCRLVAIEKRKREDKRRRDISTDDGWWVVLKYMKDTEGSGFGTVSLPDYELGDEYGTGKFTRERLSDFVNLTTSGSRHDLKCHANHDDKTLDDFIWLSQRRYGDPSGLPP